jgi:butyryl-CoA dehydrogenase
MAANYSAGIYPDLTAGAARLITSFGSKELIETYVPNMLNGNWQGTMAMTEPQAGSYLADITSTAYPTGDGYYRIKGQKIFISAGDHDGVDNVVHLMLAKIEGAPAGVKGISLFVVPKLIPSAEGQLVPNDVTVTQVYHKLGYRGCPITELSIGDKDDCIGFLLGEPHKGLSYMFQMMNEARIGVGLGATAIASAAYYAALDYAQQRSQGRNLSQKDPTLAAVPIIEHADVKRMLLFQRSVVEGALALLLQSAKYADLAKVSAEGKKEKYALLLDILTPVVKSYPSEMGILSVSQGLQCLGGYGYCQDFPLEQYYRDARIHPIHEGTTGIQGMDLLGRKVMMQDGRAYKLYLEEIQRTIEKASGIDQLASYTRKLQKACELLQSVTIHMKSLASSAGPEVFLADATVYLEFFSIIAVAWQWLKQMVSIQKGLDKKRSRSETQFYNGKFHAFRFFFSYELPKIHGLAPRLMDSDRVTVEMQPELFND